MSSPAASPTDTREHEVRLLVDMVRLSRVTLLIAEPGADKSSLIQSSVMPLLKGAQVSGKPEVAILFDAWGEAPLPPLYTRIQEALGTQATAASSLPDSQSLVASLRAWQEALGVTFVIIFDRFEEYLRTRTGRVGFGQFEEEFVQVVNDPSLRANFLLSLDEEAEALLTRLRDRIPRLGYSRVRVPRATPSANPQVPIEQSGRKPGAPEPSPVLAMRLAGQAAAATAAESRAVAKAKPATEPVTATPAVRKPQKTASPTPHKAAASAALGTQKAVPSPTVETQKVAAHAAADSHQPTTPAAPKPQKTPATAGLESRKETVPPAPDLNEAAIPVALEAQAAAAPVGHPSQNEAAPKAPEVEEGAIPVTLRSDTAPAPAGLQTQKETASAVPERKEPATPVVVEPQKTAGWSVRVPPPPQAPASSSVQAPPPRRFAKFAWVPVAVFLAVLFVFFQPPRDPSTERAAQPKGAQSPAAPSPDETAAETKHGAAPSVEPSKNEASASVDRQPAAAAAASAPPTATGAVSAAQALRQAEIGTSKTAPASSPSGGPPPAVQPARQADLANQRAMPAAPAPSGTATPTQAARKPDIAAQKTTPAASGSPSGASTVQPQRQSDLAAAKASAAASGKPVAAAPTVQRSPEPEVVAKASPVAPAQSGLAEAPQGPRLYIHVRNEAQRAWAEQMVRPLGERGIRVAAIRIVHTGPDEPDIRYFRLTERDEAMKVAVALRDFGLRAQQLKHMDELEAPGTARQYELWLPATGYDQRP